MIASDLTANGIGFVLNEPMAGHTSFRIGGPARLFVMPKTADELLKVLKLCKESDIKPFILGNGTNLLVGGRGYKGVVIAMPYLGGSFEIKDGFVMAPAGRSLFELNKFVKNNELAGLEWSFGIPGTVGGAAVMNAGAYGHEFGEFIHFVRVVEDGKFSRLSQKELNFSYRESNLKGTVVTGVCLKLKRGKLDEISGLQTMFYKKRRESQPLEFPSAGSVFKREGAVVPAKIIDSLGLKGVRVGGAEVSKKHAGFIVNKGGASFGDVLKLIDYIKKICYNNIGAILKEEIILLGEDDDFIR